MLFSQQLRAIEIPDASPLHQQRKPESPSSSVDSHDGDHECVLYAQDKIIEHKRVPQKSEFTDIQSKKFV
jgi:hypothetical protein